MVDICNRELENVFFDYKEISVILYIGEMWCLAFAVAHLFIR